MRAITIRRFGGPDVLEVRESPDPTPARGEVRVRVRATGLNFAEIMARKGLYPDGPKPPCVVGYEAAGVIDGIGAGVDGHADGDRVVIARKFGCHADTVVTDARMAFPMPEAMSFEEGAALPVNYLTAYHMLFRIAHLQPGESVLVHMAAGGVGIAVLQLCRTVPDVTVFGTASPGKHDIIREHGCAHPIDYRSIDYAEEIRRLTDGAGVDLVLDPLGGADWKKGYGLLKPLGRLVAYGFANMSVGEKRSVLRIGQQLVSVPRWSPIALMNDNRSVAGCNMGRLWGEVELLRGELESLMRLYEEGAVRPRVDKTFSFERAADAHRYIERRHNVGKVVLVP